MASNCSFTAKIGSRGFHVYRETSWQGAHVGQKVTVEIEDNALSKEIDPYCCAININENGRLVTVGHMPREISRHVFFFLSSEGGTIDGTVLSTRYRLSPIPAGGLEIPLWLTFRSPNLSTHHKMRDFVQKLYDYEYGAKIDDPDDSEPEEDSIDLSIEAVPMPVAGTSSKRCIEETVEEITGDESEEEVGKKPKRKRIFIVDDSD